jgi:hypothetical protein
MWIVPSEFSKALEGLAGLTGGGAGDSTAPVASSWLAQTGSEPTGPDPSPLDTSDWFDSNLPPAAEQPEAKNLRASDDDPASLAARVGISPDPTALAAGLPDPTAPAAGLPDPTLPPGPGQ